MAYRWLAAPAIIGCDFWDQSVHFTYLRTRSVKLIDESTVPSIRHYDGNRPTNILVSTNAKCSNRTERVSAIFEFSKRVYTPPLIQVMIIAQTEREGRIFVTPSYPTGKRIDCSAVLAIKDVKWKVPVQVMVANFSSDKKCISENQVVAFAEGVFNLKVAKTETTEEMSGISVNHKEGIENSREFPKVFRMKNCQNWRTFTISNRCWRCKWHNAYSFSERWYL